MTFRAECARSLTPMTNSRAARPRRQTRWGRQRRPARPSHRTHVARAPASWRYPASPSPCPTSASPQGRGPGSTVRARPRAGTAPSRPCGRSTRGTDWRSMAARPGRRGSLRTRAGTRHRSSRLRELPIARRAFLVGLGRLGEEGERHPVEVRQPFKLAELRAGHGVVVLPMRNDRSALRAQPCGDRRLGERVVPLGSVSRTVFSHHAVRALRRASFWSAAIGSDRRVPAKVLSLIPIACLTSARMGA